MNSMTNITSLKKVKKSCKTDKENWIESKCNEAKESAKVNDPRTLFKIVREFIKSAFKYPN